MKRSKFYQWVLSTAAAIMYLFSSSGCIYLVIGGIGAVGGYIVSPDTVEGIANDESQAVFAAAEEVVSIMGLIDEKSEEGGLIFASVHGVKVTVTVTELSETSTKVTVKARKAYLPRISLAQDVFVKIMNRVKEEAG